MAYRTLITSIVSFFLATALLAVGAPVDSNITFSKGVFAAASIPPFNTSVKGIVTSDKSFGDSLACFFSLGLDRDACEHTGKVRRSVGMNRRMVTGELLLTDHGNHTNETNSTHSTNSTTPRPMATLTPNPASQPVVSEKDTGFGAWLLCIISVGTKCGEDID